MNLINSSGSSLKYLLFGLPLSYCLAFQTNLGVYGLWLSSCIIGSCYSMTCLILMCRVDWTKGMNKRLSSLGVEDDHAVADYLRVDDIAVSTEPLRSNKHGVEGQTGEMDVVFV